MLEIQDDQTNDDEVEGSEIITELSAGDKELLELIQKLCDFTHNFAATGTITLPSITL
ncbi:hypothetical protein [Nostoc commune]|uniref:hypothetical protein n=1 Tax=Nostoc commune TaxID=1178 RepID=UPI0018C66F4D|nr:hypothetical protein [Nostoc commune]